MRRSSPSMVDVARAAGVSLGTVSNVVNDPARVSPATRQKVEAAIAELGYVRNGVARSLKAGRSTTIGFVLVDLTNSFFLDAVRGAEEIVNAAGMNLLIANADMSADRERTFLGLFEEERVAGILLTPLPLGHDVPPHPPPARVPRVHLNDPHAGPGVCSVTTDNERGGYLAARHLIEYGRRRLLFAGADQLEPVRHRLDGARRAVLETNGAVTLTRLHTEWVRAHDGRGVAEQLLGWPEADRPDGVLAGADLLALGVIQGLTLDGRLRVPDDVAVVGYDNNRAAWDSVIPMTTFDQAGEEMGRAAAALLLEEIEQGGAHDHRVVRLEPFLVPRESTVGR